MFSPSFFKAEIALLYENPLEIENLKMIFFKIASFFTPSLELSNQIPSLSEIKKLFNPNFGSKAISTQKFFKLYKKEVISLLSFYELISKKSFENLVKLKLNFKKLKIMVFFFFSLERIGKIFVFYCQMLIYPY